MALNIIPSAKCRVVWVQIALMCLLFGCDVYSEDVAPGYGLQAIDSYYGMTLVYDYPQISRVVVKQTVTAIGVDENHIIVKQQSIVPGQPWPTDTNYFIIALDPRGYSESNVHGPFEPLDRFNEARASLGVAPELTLRNILKWVDRNGRAIPQLIEWRR